MILLPMAMLLEDFIKIIERSGAKLAGLGCCRENRSRQARERFVSKAFGGITRQDLIA